MEKKEYTIEKVEDSAKFLHESGLLGEINRMVLHPLGYALTLVKYDDGRVEFEGLRKTNDPAGYYFDDLSDVADKLTKYFPDIHERMRCRLRQYGFITQPLPITPESEQIALKLIEGMLVDQLIPSEENNTDV